MTKDITPRAAHEKQVGACGSGEGSPSGLPESDRPAEVMDIRMGLLMADLELAAETAQDDAMGVWRNGADEIRERRQAEADALELTPPVEVEEPTFIDRLPINLSWFVVSGIIGLTWVQIGRGITKQGWPLWFSIGIGCAISAFCLLCLCVIGVGKEADRGRW